MVKIGSLRAMSESLHKIIIEEVALILKMFDSEELTIDETYEELKSLWTEEIVPYTDFVDDCKCNNDDDDDDGEDDYV